jgi:hypothetical protein
MPPRHSANRAAGLHWALRRGEQPFFGASVRFQAPEAPASNWPVQAYIAEAQILRYPVRLLPVPWSLASASAEAYPAWV